MRIVSLALSLLFLSCNHPFTPNGPFERNFVVYSVLSGGSSLQFVRVYSNYNVSGSYPYENTSDTPVIGARVVVTGPHGSYIFTDTLLPRADTSRYTTSIVAYAARFQPEPGETYTLTVEAAGMGSTRASVILPDASRTLAWSPSPWILWDPETPAPRDIEVTGSVSFQTKAYTHELVIDYDVLQGDGWRSESQVVPFSGSTTSPVCAPMFGAYGRVGGWYGKGTYLSTLKFVSNKYAGRPLTFRRVVFRLLQFDQNWYDYYNIVRRAEDLSTTRLDQPDFTNVSHGYGLIGACTFDSLVYCYPDTFKFNRR